MSHDDRCGGCGGPDHVQPASRREFLYVGLIGGLGLTLGQYFNLQTGAGRRSVGHDA